MNLKTGMALVLPLICNVALAEWVSVGSTGGNPVYADPTTIRRTGDIAKMWSLFDLKVAQDDDNGKLVLSGKSQDEYDCKEEKHRRLYFVTNVGAMGEGAVASVSDKLGNWTPIAPRSMNEALWKFVCTTATSVGGASDTQPSGAGGVAGTSSANLTPPKSPSSSETGFFKSWLKGKMVSLQGGEEFAFEIEKSTGTGGMWAANPKTGEVLQGQYTAKGSGGGYSTGSVSGTNSAGRYTTQNVQIFSPPTSANAQGYLRGDKGTVIEIYLEIKPGWTPTGFGPGNDNKGNRYQVQF